MIDGKDFSQLEAEKYWSFPSSYSKERKRKETTEMIFSGDYIGSRKYDGHYYKFIKDEETKLQGRNKSTVTKDYLNKIGHVPHLNSFFDLVPEGTCLLGELYFKGNEGSKNVTTIMGCKEDKAIARQEKGPKLCYYIFDILAWGGISCLEMTAEERFDFLQYGAPSVIMEQSHNKYVSLAEYYEGQDLWEQYQEILAEGGEGVVITKKDSIPNPGKRTARKTLKLKKELTNTIDCFLTGNYRPPTRDYTGKELKSWKYWENVKTNEKLEGEFYEDYYLGKPIEPVTKPYFYGWAGSLEIGVIKSDDKPAPKGIRAMGGYESQFKGYPVYSIGYLSGVTEEIKAGVVEEPDKYILRCCEVSAMEIDDESGALRHAKFEGFRDDLAIEDCNWEKIYGK